MGCEIVIFFSVVVSNENCLKILFFIFFCASLHLTLKSNEDILVEWQNGERDSCNHLILNLSLFFFVYLEFKFFFVCFFPQNILFTRTFHSSNSYSRMSYKAKPKQNRKKWRHFLEIIQSLNYDISIYLSYLGIINFFFALIEMVYFSGHVFPKFEEQRP